MNILVFWDAILCPWVRSSCFFSTDPEDKDTTMLLNVCSYSPNNMSHPRHREFWASPLWKPHTSYTLAH
jgi:hypothetical protein